MGRGSSYANRFLSRTSAATMKVFAEGSNRLGAVRQSIRSFESKALQRLNPLKELTISSPIKGNPSAILKGYGELSKKQLKALDALPKFGSTTTLPKKMFSQNDLASLTAATGDEFAMFTRGSKRMIMRGDFEGVPITPSMGTELAGKGWRWSAHTHPGGESVLRSSVGDRMVLEAMQGNSSAILNSEGRRVLFNKNGDLLTGWLPR